MSSDYKLPNGLLIILHLHLLNYPLQNATGYDERLFDASRGMRDRNKAMEDITYFLVGKIDGSKERAKSILSTYPCLQPSDTTAFRIALAKYLEAMRNAIVHTTHAGDTKGKQPAQDEAPAWWWKDVVVRKSILDECSGDRFERLMLALSSHAVLKNTAKADPLRLSGSPQKDREEDLDMLSKVYTARLAAAQSARLEWERAAAILVQRQLDLEIIRARLADPKLAGSSKYDSLETDRLLALRDSRNKDLLRGHWKNEDGHAALRLINELAGLLDDSAAETTTSIGVRDNTGADALPVQESQTLAAAPPPLPITAAHHPVHLHALRATLFPKPEPSHADGGDEELDDASAQTTVPHAVTERLAAIDKVNASLQTALANAQSIHAQLQHRMDQARSQVAGQQPVHKPKSSVSGQLKLDTNLWCPRHGKGVDFKKPADGSALALFGLTGSPSDSVIEDRIAHIRTTLLPPFTADPLPASDSEPEAPASQPASRLRPPSSRTQVAGSRSVPSAKGAAHQDKPRAASGTKQVRVADAPKATRVPSASGPGRGAAKASATARRLSRRASAAKTRRSTMFGRGSDAAILRIVEAVQDRSDSEDGDDAEDERPVHEARTPLPRTPARSQMQGTRGMLLSSVKKSGPRQSFDIDKYERVKMPRLPSLSLETAPELEEEEDVRRFNGERKYVEGDTPVFEDGVEDEVAYEGNSMTLADILLQAGHQGNAFMQLLEEDELEDMSDWE